uniref:HECT-type E3 ubiquitin transferase n=1 Tax=Albugo laibachii Nc14 TaxID=890382 RepID=F0WEA1_9STRA|nr:HECT E3 ubiquitin ligase putative [Albugo laibachii Nc14]|eukprot:CCA19532.1 HECT E3 ubiquitin ligase putative [Albugo laibachii Nc14]
MSNTSGLNQVRLTRQASVLHEIQDIQSKGNMDNRYARLMSELASICNDRHHIITLDSFTHITISGRSEPVRLQRQLEKPTLDHSNLLKSHSGASSIGISNNKVVNHRQDLERVHVDAARRQRVEELARFFMEAKSDIEFALGNNSQSRHARELRRNIRDSSREKEIESERDEELGIETGDEPPEETEQAKYSSIENDSACLSPEEEALRLHMKLLHERLDDRVFNGLLSELRENDAALFGAIQCHPLVTGVDSRSDKRRKKKRKDRERKEKSINFASSSTSTPGNPSSVSSNPMLTPDFDAEPLSPEELRMDVSKFVAKAIQDGSLQALLLATKLVLWFTRQTDHTEDENSLPIASHLRVLKGGKAPEGKLPRNLSEISEVLEKNDNKLHLLPASCQRSEEGFFEEERREDIAVVEISEHDCQLSEEKESDDRSHAQESKSHETTEEETADEDALMARAIALSLSPEIALKEQADIGETLESEVNATSESLIEQPVRPPAFSSAEFLALGPFSLSNSSQTNGLTTAMTLLAKVNDCCVNYLEAARKGTLTNENFIQPHPMVFMLINSILNDLQVASLHGKNHYKAAKWILFQSCGRLIVLRVLECNLFHIDVVGLSPASVGLGQSTSCMDPISGNKTNSNHLVDSLHKHVVRLLEQMRSDSSSDQQDVLEPLVFIPESDCSADHVEKAAYFYWKRIGESALSTWARSIGYFYKSQSEMYRAVCGALNECTELLERGELRPEHLARFRQVDILCARLSLPDLAQMFVPQCPDIVQENGAVVDQDEFLDDAVVQGFLTRQGSKESLHWKPEIVKKALVAGELSARSLYDLMSKYAPSGYLEGAGVSIHSGNDARSNELLAGAYEHTFNHLKQKEAEALECIKGLPALIDLLRESILSSTWPSFSFKDDHELLHAPLIPILEKRKKNDMWTLNARVLFLRALQDLLIDRLSRSRGVEASPLEFDPSRCAETMTLSKNNRTAKQYTAKQWGMVMATTGCAPNTGIHEWAVRLDRCEKGHIFLGVCTRDASVATYVGGDRQGWGLIGTRALWHNRSKVRGDYGDGYSTGSTVRVRLNTDSGALSFGLDDSDWGIAFDGLTQHGTLYPAIGLYQRDDQVTILPVQSIHVKSDAEISLSNRPNSVSVPAVLVPFVHHTSMLMESCCLVMNSVTRAAGSREEIERTIKNPLLGSLLAPLTASLTLVRTYHGLSATIALHMIPWTICCMQSLEAVIRVARESFDSRCSLETELQLNVEGEWELKSMATGSIPAQQYHLALTQSDPGIITGRGNGSFASVTLNGAVRGTKVCFIETWRQSGTCFVEGRLRTDGRAFNGTYEDAKGQTCGSIVGGKVDSNEEISSPERDLNNLVVLEMIVSNLFGRLSHELMHLSVNDDILTEVATELKDSDDDTPENAKSNSEQSNVDEYEEWTKSSLLSGGLPDNVIKTHLNRLVQQLGSLSKNIKGFYPSSPLNQMSAMWLDAAFPSFIRQDGSNEMQNGKDVFLQDLITANGIAYSIDRWISRHVGESPMTRIGGESFKIARRTICAAMIWHSGFLPIVKRIAEARRSDFIDSETRPQENLMHIWRAAQRVTEWGIRSKNALGSTYAVVAERIIRKAQFLLEIQPSDRALSAATTVSVYLEEGSGANAIISVSAFDAAERICSETLMQVSRFLEARIRVSHLETRLLMKATKAFFRIIGFGSMRFFLGDTKRAAGTASSEVLSSAVQSCAMHWLSPLLRHSAGVHAGGDLLSGTGETTMHLYQSASQHVPSAYYGHDLCGSGRRLMQDLQDSFEALYGSLCANLSRATWAKDTDLQLVILQAWGMIVRPEDHAFLSRVGIFRVLQTVLDEARTADSVTAAVKPERIDERTLVLEARKKVVQAGLKVVHLLAAQVAQTGETYPTVPPAGLSSQGLGSIPLVRKPSGPETLGKSVFNMLFTELRNVVRAIAHDEESASFSLYDSSSACKLGKQASVKSESLEYCYQICSLLYSVSGSPVCRSHLSASRWLKLLLSLVSLQSTNIRRRILKLLRRLLPTLDPAVVTFQTYPVIEEGDMLDFDSDEEVDCASDTSENVAMLLDYFFDVVSSLIPPSMVERMLLLPDSGGNEQSGLSISHEFHDTLGTEVILLLKALYDSSKWAPFMNRSVLFALQGVHATPTISNIKVDVSRPRASRNADSDVEMEDTAGLELPSRLEWHTSEQSYRKALCALSVLEGYIVPMQVGAKVKIIPRGGSSIHECALRGVKGTIVEYEADKATAQIIVGSTRVTDTDTLGNTFSSRPIRVAVDDLVCVPEIDLNIDEIAIDVLEELLIHKFRFYVEEIKKSVAEVKQSDFGRNFDLTEDNDDDDMSNDGSATPSAIDSEMASAGLDEAESEIESESASPVARTCLTDKSAKESSTKARAINNNDIAAEIEREYQLNRMLLCQQGTRSMANILNNRKCAAVFVNGVGTSGLEKLFTISNIETPTGGLADLVTLEESWLYLWSRWIKIRTASSKREKSVEPQELLSGNSAPVPLVQQMMEMGFPKEWCEIALAKCANNVEAAINFCFEHSSDMERLLAQYKATKEGCDGGLLHRRDDKDVVPLLEQLSEMGFPAHWCKKALAANRNNVDAALTWILSNGEILEAEDRREEISKTLGSNEEVESLEKCSSTLPPNPLRLVSGQASINESTMMVEGLVGGGFASVGAPDCMVSSGRWYYEAVLHTNGCIQIGWADTAFCGAADRGDGVGDGPHSWAYDGWRQQKWHGQSSPWGSKWNQGDVVGCGVDADSGAIIFTLNGKMRSVNMGVAFRAIDFGGGLYPCASFNRRERLQFNLGGKPFKFAPPPGFRPILEALTTYVHELHVHPDKMKGFGIIGLREDALEEAIGDESYFSEGRYFSRDSHMPTMLRGSAGHSRSSGAAGSIKSDVLAELKSISDDRIYMELLLISRSLAILHARRTVLTLLAKWPTSSVGPFTLSSLMEPDPASQRVGEASLLLEFVKLVAGSTGQSAIAASVGASGISEDVDIGLLLSTGGASGRQLLSLLASSVRSALQSNASEKSGSTQALVDVFLMTIQSEVCRVAERQYSRVPWDSSDSAISSCLLQISSESGAPWSDKEILHHPNIFLAEWLTKLLMERISSAGTDEPACKNDSIRRRLLSSWVVSLRSPSMCVKQRGMAIIAGILQDLLSTVYVEQDDGSKAILTSVMQDLPVKRLVILTEERLQKEYASFPVCSKYLQSLVELVSTIALGIDAVGSCMLKYFYSDMKIHLASCKALKRDLYPGDLEEYETVKRKEEESITQPESNESSDRNPPDSSEKVENEAIVEVDHRAGNTSMEIDNSDSEDVPGITLSAIANMVAEDSDVVSAAAAIAAAANTRLTVRRQVALKELQQSKVPEQFRYVFPEAELPVNLEDLSEEECMTIEAAKEGISGNEITTWPYGFERGVLSDNYAEIWSGTITQYRLNNSTQYEQNAELEVGSRVIRGPDWKWRDQDGGEGSIGIVEGISPWSGVDGEGISVRWPSDAVYTYRWGSDGHYDLTHVDVDDEGKIVKKYPVMKPKYDDDGSFGAELHLGVLLHLAEQDGDESDRRKVTGVMEWPDYNAASSVVGWRYKDGSLCLQELQLLRGSTDMGWQLRFGTEKWQPGTKYNLKMVENGENSDAGQSLAGMFAYPALKKDVIVENRGEIRISNQHLFKMDPHNHFPTLSISEDGMSVTCMNGDTRNLALGTVGFTSGVYYWEVRVDQAEFGSVFIGVCEKPGPPGSHSALSNRLNRWNGWGFVNFRASYHNSTERIYGDHFNAGDTIGVRLDMEQGKLSFFMDGIKYGEHIVTDLGVAFENIKGDRNTRTLYPCIGMRKGGDRVCLNGKWIALPGIPPKQLLLDAIDVDAQLHAWFLSMNSMVDSGIKLSENVLLESWALWKRWCENRWERYPVRPRGVIVDFDTYISTCIQVCKKAGLHAPFLTGDRVRICSKGGRELDQPEEAIILGVHRGHIWYRTETQGNEGAEEGRSWAWYFSTMELMELILVKRGGKDPEEFNFDTVDDSSLALKPQPFTGRSRQETLASTSFSAFMELATAKHTAQSDMQLVERLNEFCSTMGLDIANLKIADLMSPEEQDANKETLKQATRPGIQPFMNNFSAPLLNSLSGPELRARCAVLRVLNSKILRVLSLICIQPAEASNTSIQLMKSAEVERSRSGSLYSSWQYPSTSLKLRSLRQLIFTSTKRSFWESLLRATTTPTPLPSDEYEDPREIRVIRINRIQAQPSKLSLLAQPDDRLRRSVFGQLYREMRSWMDSSFRRAYCGKGHGGQRRAFKVKFLGEGVNDYGGPYRAVFEQVVDELQLDNVELSKGEQGLLPLLIPCPNRRTGTGSNQDKFLLNPSCGISLQSNAPMALELYRFLGKLIGTAVRHGLQMGLNLPSLVWRPIAGLEVGRPHLESVDVAATNNLMYVEEFSGQDAKEFLEHLTFSTPLSDGNEIPLCPGGEKLAVTFDNRLTYVHLVEQARLTESTQQLAALRSGLATVLPMEAAALFTSRELETLICGRREVDVELLRQCTEYDTGVEESMPHVQHFWEVLTEMTNEERTSFLRFVWARSRMPNSAKDFPMNFKIQTAHGQSSQEDPDKYLPHAQTCFFSLSLPAYTSKEILRSKLLYAIQNSPNMDADVRLHNAEGWADA